MRLVSLPRRKLYFILIPTAAIIFAAAMETLLRVKDASLFANWLELYESREGVVLAPEDAFNIYVAANLGHFLHKIIIPVVLSLHSYFAHVKLNINGLFIFLWTVLVVGGMAQSLLEFNFYSIFYYLSLAAYLALALAVLSLTTCLEKSKSR